MNIKVTIDADLCVGSGDCARVAPNAFEVDESSGLAVVQDGVAQTPSQDLEDAAYQCPTGAITLRPTDG